MLWIISEEIQSRIAFHVLAIWYIQAKGKFHIIPMLRDMFHDLELEDDCAEVIDRFPGVVDIVNKNFPSKIKMGTKALEKGKKSKTAASQSNCSSISPLHPIRENGEITDMEEQMPELVDISDNEISSVRENQQGSITENQSVNVTFEDENSRITPPNPQVLMKNLQKE